MNAVGIDVSKGKSTVTIRRPGDMVILAPQDYYHTQSSINELITLIKSLEGETKVCMEHTGRYYEPVASRLSSAGIFVSAVNERTPQGRSHPGGGAASKVLPRRHSEVYAQLLRLPSRRAEPEQTPPTVPLFTTRF